jgi:hypothetical protein
LGSTAGAAAAESMFKISSPGNDSIQVRFIDLVLGSHTATSSAAAITVSFGKVNLTLANVDIFDMKAPAGAVLMFGSFNSSSDQSSLSVNNGTFARCASTEAAAFAAALNPHGIGRFHISNVTFFNNTGAQAAAVLALHTSTVSVTSCTFRQNTAVNGQLSATALVLGVDSAVISGNHFIQNNGSPLVIYGSKSLTAAGPNPSSIQVQQCSFIRNTGSITGALAVGMAALTCVTNSSFEGNFGSGAGYDVTANSSFGPVGGLLIDTTDSFVGDALSITDNNANYTYLLSVRALRQYNQPLPPGLSTSEASLFNSKITGANTSLIKQSSVGVYAPSTLMTNLNLCMPMLATSANSSGIILSTSSAGATLQPGEAGLAGSAAIRVCDAMPAGSTTSDSAGVLSDCSRCVFTGPLQCSAWTAAMISSQKAHNKTASNQTSLYRNHPVIGPSIDGMVATFNEVFASALGVSVMPPKLFI